MSYTYLDHEADIGIRCKGKSLREAFEEGGRALMNLMADPEKIKPVRTISMECRAPGIDTLFVAYLNEIISQVGRKDILFTSVEISEIRREGEDYILRAFLRGEEIDPTRHDLKTEVKGATYYGLDFIEEAGVYTLQCVVDI